MSIDIVRPFRWDVTRRNQLGRLVDIGPAPMAPELLLELGRCCARVLAFAGDSDLVFIGRSPESLFDLLSGFLEGTSRAGRASLLNLSLKWTRPSRELEVVVAPYLDRLGLSPAALARRPGPVAFVDVVWMGTTFERLVGLLYRWSERENLSWPAVASRIRLVGLTERTKTSPKTWRWQQHVEWAGPLHRGAVKNVSVEPALFQYLADLQPKTSVSFDAWRWRDPAVARPPRSKQALRALALAFWLYDLGRAREGKAYFAGELARQPATREAWFRSLILELKR